MALTDAADAIDAFAIPVTRRRYEAMGRDGLYDRDTGKWIDNVPWNPGPAETTIQAAVLAMKPSTLRDLPEGVRADAVATIWSRSNLRAADDSTGTVGDEILWRGEWYRVTFLWPRPEGGFTKAALGAIRDRGRTVHTGD
jgi:hypothetical protein